MLGLEIACVVLDLVQFYCDRYICSSGEKKSVMCLFDDYLKSWVCDALNCSAFFFVIS